MRVRFVCLWLAALAWNAAGQEFEVVSVKPNKSESGSSSSNSNLGRLTATNNSLKTLILMAYGVPEYRVEGPAWLTSEHFDVAAKFPEALPKDPEKYRVGFQAMMQKMLADRFKLQVHREQKTFTVYALVVGKNGIKFKEAADTASGSQSNSNNTHYTGKNVSMSRFAEFLARRVDMPVVDMTDLKATYDLKLDWVPESKEKKDDTVSFADAGPALPQALQEQLGLKLEIRKAPIEVVVVDHAERVPTEN